MADITRALSDLARKYLADVFECTTREHLIALGKDDGLNVFEENLANHQDGNDHFHLDEEIAEYLKAVRDGREPWDPAEHEFDFVKTGSGWEIQICGPATGGEQESIYVKDPKPSLSEAYYLFNQFVRPRGE